MLLDKTRFIKTRFYIDMWRDFYATEIFSSVKRISENMTGQEPRTKEGSN